VFPFCPIDTVNCFWMSPPASRVMSSAISVSPGTAPVTWRPFVVLTTWSGVSYARDWKIRFLTPFKLAIGARK
jgi:hypothetical protein